MKRTNILSLLSFFLFVVIVSPTIVQLLDSNDSCSIAMMELNDEENKKENKKKEIDVMDEEDVIISSNPTVISLPLEEKTIISTSYMLTSYVHSEDIVLPPPKLDI